MIGLIALSMLNNIGVLQERVVDRRCVYPGACVQQVQASMRSKHSAQGMLASALPTGLTCPSDSNVARDGLSAWSEIKQALSSVTVVNGSALLFATRVDYRRTQQIGDSLFRQRASYAVGPIGSWVSDASAVHSAGYAKRAEPESLSLMRPTIEILLDPFFTTDHCFEVDSKADGTRIVKFEPRPERANVVELEGRVTVGADPHELRKLEFSYVHVPPPQRTKAGGEVVFEKSSTLPGVFITSWRMNDQDGHTDGSTLLTVEIGDDTVWRHSSVRLDVHVVEGVVRRPGADVNVSVNGESSTATTDSDGRASFTRLPVGNHMLVVRDGNRERHMGITLLEPVTDVVVDIAGVVPSEAIAIAGIIRNVKTGGPVPGAEVMLIASGESARTDSSGHFRITSGAAGSEKQVALIRRIGFIPRTIDVPSETNDSANIIELEPVTTLDSVVVSERSTVAALASFEEHRRIGLGHFWTRKDLAAYTNGTLSQVLAQTPGMDTKAAMKGFVASTRRPGGSCLSQVYLDQALVYRGRGQGFNVNSLRPDQVEAIEYYSGPAQLPAKYQGLNADCGVIVIWTRRTP